MVGWSRRNSEASERRARWFNSLTPEKKAEVLTLEKQIDRFTLLSLVVIAAGFIAVILLVWAYP